MALIVEDGTIVANANTLVTEFEFESYAEGMGVTISGEIEPILRKAMQFVDSFDARMKGSRVSRDQALSFPRSDFEIDGWSWGETEIPRAAILAQLAVALDIAQGIDPYNPPQAKIRTKERVEGAVEVAYAAPTAGFKLSKSSSSEALINALLRSSGLTLAVVRS